MPLKGLAKLEFLEVIAYSDIERKSKVGSYEVMFNPESLRQHFSTNFRSKQALESTGKEAEYINNPSSTLDLTLIIDGSTIGAAFSMNRLSLTGVNVKKEVDKFKALAYDLNGEKHEPNFLELVWGEIGFSCRLQSFSVIYTSFGISGKPLRAEISASFVQEVSDAKRQRQSKVSSPDLTHKRLVKKGDTLPLLAKRIYGDASLYLMLARFNELDDFRNLKEGREIIFPPLDKEA